MVDAFSVGVIVAEFVGIVIVGLVLGKVLHALLKVLMALVLHKTHMARDEHFLQAIEGSLQALSIVWLFYYVTGRLEGLNAVNKIVNQYAYSILVLLIAYSVSEFVDAFLKFQYKKTTPHSLQLDESMLPFFRKVLRVLVLGVGFSIALSGLGLDLSGLLTATGVAALVLGLAAQETLANIFAGLALQWDRPFLYGDQLEFSDGLKAELLSIGLRSSKLADEKGNVIVLSNSQFAQARIIKLKKDPREKGPSKKPRKLDRAEAPP